MSRPTNSNRQGAAFLRRVTLACSWGEGLDGFDLGVISVTLVAIIPAFDVGTVMAGLLGASSLIGIFLGGPATGYLVDRFGRRVPFIADIVVFLVLNAMQAVVTDAVQLLVVRVLLGMAIGAEYTIGATVLAESTPTASRGRRLSSLLVCWYVGFLTAVAAAYAIIDLAGLSWRWALALGTVPALVTLVVRIGLPESPRWLASRGRAGEARAVVTAQFGDETYFDREELGEPQHNTGYAEVFGAENRRRLMFVCIFWSCQVAPYFAIFTFAPVVFASLDLSDPAVTTLVANAIAALGALGGMLTIERLGRRMQLIPPFWIMAGALGIVGLWSGAPGAVIVLAFALFSFFNALASNLTAVYPIEVFPTAVRSSAVGICAAVSRIAAAIGTFLLPVGIDHWGVSTCVMIGAGLCVIGAVVSQRMAPETTGRPLSRTSASIRNPQPAA